MKMKKKSSNSGGERRYGENTNAKVNKGDTNCQQGYVICHVQGTISYPKFYSYKNITPEYKAYLISFINENEPNNYQEAIKNRV
jgi:hypothetical protein